jgi:hypothetical protein
MDIPSYRKKESLCVWLSRKDGGPNHISYMHSHIDVILTRYLKPTFCFYALRARTYTHARTFGSPAAEVQTFKVVRRSWKRLSFNNDVYIIHENPSALYTMTLDAGSDRRLLLAHSTNS